MKALILNGGLKGDEGFEKARKLTEEIIAEQGYETDYILLREKEIGECLGCFGCWVKTPGVCVVEDYGQILAENIINSDMVIFLTPVVYGGYSSELKKALDRIIPLLLPFFKKVNGEVHHKKRYEKYPKVVVLGMMSEEDNEDKELFESLVKRNSLNWYNSFVGGIIIDNSEKDIKYQIRDKLKAMEVSRC